MNSKEAYRYVPELPKPRVDLRSPRFKRILTIHASSSSRYHPAIYLYYCIKLHENNIGNIETSENKLVACRRFHSFKYPTYGDPNIAGAAGIIQHCQDAIREVVAHPQCNLRAAHRMASSG